MKKEPFEPSYLKTYHSGELNRRIQKLTNYLHECKLCPRECGVDRIRGEKGYCQAGASMKVSSVFPHFGEERPLVGRNGSGTIFFSHCNLLCEFCQNYQLSHFGEGDVITEDKLAQFMLKLQRGGCHNINLVTPTHFVPQIVSALPRAIELGLRLPIVYNCGGYESIEVIKLLDGIIDIYMPDAKFANDASAKKYMNVSNYFSVCKKTLKEMHRQVGDLKVDNQGIAYRGLLIRHLIMPNEVAGTTEILEFIHNNLSSDSYVNVMSQYSPHYKANKYPLINRRLSYQEYENALATARRLGLHIL